MFTNEIGHACTRRVARRVGVVSLLVLGTVVFGCDDGNIPPSPPNGDVRSLTGDLTVGSRGDEVRIVHDYLTKYGYYPNESLAHDYPAWRPVITAAPADPALYDESTADAVGALQAHAGLRATGAIDEPTRAFMRSPRCGVPDGIAEVDGADKFALIGPTARWTSRQITWKVVNTGAGITQAQAEIATFNALATWAAETGLQFIQLFGPAPADIEIRFMHIDGPNNIIAQTSAPPASRMTVDIDERWSVAVPTPGGALDLQTTLLHELGHAQGLHHSSIAFATMLPTYPGQDRTLDIDDKVGISYWYDAYTLLNGRSATDVGVGAEGSIWITGTVPLGGGFQIFKWNGSGWDGSDGQAVRLAVDPSGRPWVVTNANTIYRHTTNSPFTGTWELLPGTATDIGIGLNGSVWITGTVPFGGGYQIFKWNGAGWDGSDGQAVRIAVGPNGNPWVVTNAGTVYRRSTSDPFTGTWELLPGSSVIDIGISAGGYAWNLTAAPRGLATLSLWNEQAAVGSAPARRTWLPVLDVTNPSNNVSVAVGTNGRPFVVSTGAVLTSIQ